MPARRRPKPAPPPPLSDAERFAAALRDDEHQRAATRRAARAQADAAQAAAQAEQRRIDHAVAVRTEHEAAVANLKAARAAGRGIVAAEQRWRAAAAAKLELDTGVAPGWTPRPADDTTSELPNTEPDT